MKIISIPDVSKEENQKENIRNSKSESLIAKSLDSLHVKAYVFVFVLN